MKKRKILGILLCVVTAMSIFLSGCGSEGATSSNTPATNTSNSTASLEGKESILIGIPVPLTGNLASFGEGSPFMEELAVKTINDQGGIYIKELDKKLPVELIFMDTESNPTKASEAATKMVLESKVDLLVVRHTPDTVNPVSAVAERYGVPCISLDAASDAWLAAGPYKWSYHGFWKVENIYSTFKDMWKAAGLEGSTVGVVFPNDPDGTTFNEIFANLEKDGYKIVNPGFTTTGQNDFTSIIDSFKKNGVEIVTGVNINPDFATFWKQSKQMGFNPKMVTMAKAYLLDSQALALGADNADGLTTEVWWTPDYPYVSSLTGQTGKELTDLWTAAKGTIWTQPMGYKYASLEVALDALNRAQSLDKETIRQAIADTDLDTLVGKIKFGENHHCVTAVTGGQWVKTADGGVKLNIVTNGVYTDIPLTGEIKVAE